jgi:CRP-like cAMP-binding protein
MNVQHCVRASGPASAVRAAEHVHSFAPSQCDRILSAIGQLTANRLGATAAEIGEACGLTVVQVARRLPELRRAGRTLVLQHDSGDLMRNGYRCWALVRS